MRRNAKVDLPTEFSEL